MSRLVLLAFLFLSCSAAAEVRVFAAASLTDALTEIAAAWEKDGGQRIVFNSQRIQRVRRLSHHR